MISNKDSNCPNCGGYLKYYDKVPRMIKTKGGIKTYLSVRRFKCSNCYKLHRELPENIFPYKHYEAEIIKGVLDGFITTDTLGYEDYPCEMTMSRWARK